MNPLRRRRLGGGAFNPSQIPGLVLWLKADSLGLSDGTAVSTWSDLSGAGNNVTQATGAKQPTYKAGIVGGHGVVRFVAASAQVLASAGNAPMTGDVAMTMFAVAAPTSAATAYCHLSFGGFSSLAGCALFSGLVSGNLSLEFGGGNGARANTGDVTTGFQVISTAKTPGTISTQTNLYRNKTLETLGTSSANTPAVTAGPFFVGQFGSGGASNLNGDIAEALIFSQRLSDASISQVQSYLRTAYGL